MSIGESLAEARREAGLSITQVSQRTRIRESIIRGIEQGDFSLCGGDFYARGHIRSIATAVGADPVPLIREYDAEHGAPGAITAADVFEPSTPIRLKRQRRSPSLAMIVIVLLLAVIGYAGYHLVSRGGGRAAAAVTTRPTPTVSAVRTATPPSPSPSPSAGTMVIRLAASQNCWLLLRRTHDNSQIYMGDIAAGNTMSWTVKVPVTLELGNPPGVHLTVNGNPVATNSAQVLTLKLTPQHPPT